MSHLDPAVKEWIFARRSIRKFTDEPVPHDLIEELIECASMAPSGSNVEAWEFIIADDPETVKKIVTFSPGISGDPPCIVICCTDRKRAVEKGGKLGEEMSVIDLSMAAENFMLAADTCGLGTCAIKAFRPAVITKLYNLPEHIVPEYLLTLGYTAKKGPVPKRRPVSDILHFNEF